MNSSITTGRNIGAAIGLLIFLVFGGFLISSTYGGYAGLTLINSLGFTGFGIISRIVTAISMLVGIFCGGAVSIVSGGILGTVLGWANGVVVDKVYHVNELS